MIERPLETQRPHQALERALEVLGLLARPDQPGRTRGLLRSAWALRARLAAVGASRSPTLSGARSCRFLRRQLRVHDLLVGLAGLHELLMRAQAHDGALVEHDDLLGVHDAADPLSHYKHGGVGDLALESRAEQRVGLEVESETDCRRRRRRSPSSRERGRWRAAVAGPPTRSCLPA